MVTMKVFSAMAIDFFINMRLLNGHHGCQNKLFLRCLLWLGLDMAITSQSTNGSHGRTDQPLPACKQVR